MNTFVTITEAQAKEISGTFLQLAEHRGEEARIDAEIAEAKTRLEAVEEELANITATLAQIESLVVA